MKLLSAIGVLLALCAPARAQEQKNYNTVQQLRNFCRGEDGEQQRAYCLGFIAGVGFVMLANGDAGSAGLWTACGGNPTQGALRQAFLNWADQHPEHWSDSALSGVALAIKATWPCPPR